MALPKSKQDLLAKLDGVNKHYLNRYFKFIENSNGSGEVSHHILPRSLFPEFVNLFENKWNDAKLSERHHYIAHLLLWKACNNKEMTYALNMMSNFRGIKTSRLYEKLRNDFKEQLKEDVKSREKFGTKGLTTVIDKDGNRLSVSTDDPRYVSGELPHFLKGVKKDYPTTKGQVTVKDKYGNTFNVLKSDERYISGELVHISTGNKRDDFSKQRKNMVIAKDINGKIFEVSKEEFHNRDDLYGVRKDLSNLRGENNDIT